ncbi:MAG: hypothetical protein COA79_09965 [Planctomycetota bacterium]|nr:MAG: hypothetical protein COA79_09965 [Planctomycetota bacterium]
MIEAVFFDMDGTLIDTEILYAKALKVTLEEKGINLSLDEVIAIVYGRSWVGVFETVEKKFPARFHNAEELEVKTTLIFNKLIENDDFIIQSSLNLLTELATQLPIAIVSGSSRVHLKEFLERMKISHLVDFFIGSEDCKKSKPSPEGYLKAAKKMKVSPVRCLVFEDSLVGVQAAKAAKMKCVALKREGAPSQDVSAADEIMIDLSLFDKSQLSF